MEIIKSQSFVLITFQGRLIIQAFMKWVLVTIESLLKSLVIQFFLNFQAAFAIFV